MDSSSDEDAASDEEMYRIFNITIFRKSRRIMPRPNHFELFGDKDFFVRFRLSKASAYSILELIAPHIKNKTNWNNALTEEQMFLITLRVYATGGMLRTIGDVYGVSVSTVSKVVEFVTNNIARLRPQFVTFPSTEEEILQTKREFYDIAKFPNVIAALDCTHVKIKSPGGNSAELYRNRKGFYSVNVQTMCDANLKITNIVARWPGSAHDSNILRNSRIYGRFENGEFRDNLIVADSGYPNKRYIMTPLLTVRSPADNLYNESQIRTRSCVERSYGVWKRRFPILSLGIRLKFKKAESIIVATAVLHNICCINKEMNVPELPADIEAAVNWVSSVPNNRSSSNNNNIVRRHLIDDYYRNLL